MIVDKFHIKQAVWSKVFQAEINIRNKYWRDIRDIPRRTVSRTPSLTSSSRASSSTATSTTSRGRSQASKPEASKKLQTDKVADKEVVGQVGTGQTGPTVNNESPVVPSSSQAGQERKISERNERKVSRPGGQGERKTSDKVEAAGPMVKKVSKIEKKESAVIISKNVSTLKKVSSRQDVLVKKDSRVEDSVSVNEESHHANQDRKVSKVVTKNNDAIVKSDDDDNEDDIDNDSVEDDIENVSVFNANKTRKSSEPPPVMRSVEIVNKDSVEIHSQRKQSFLNPFEPPCPELVNKSKLIEEFNTVQEQNLKNNIKDLEEPLMKESLGSIEPSTQTYFTSQALNNATSSTINQVRFLSL